MFWLIGCVHRGSPLFVFLIKYDCANGLYYFSRAESFDIIHRKQIHEYGSGYCVRAFMLGVSPSLSARRLCKTCILNESFCKKRGLRKVYKVKQS